MRLNLGSGKRDLEGFVNIDAVKQTPNTVLGDILNLDYPDGSIEEIYSEHVIEHFDKNEIDVFFKECSRLLKSGGKLHIIAPSIIKAMSMYNDNGYTIDQLDNFLFALHTHKYDFHKQSIYKEKLFRLCDKHDFKVDKCHYQDRDFSNNEIVLKATKI